MFIYSMRATTIKFFGVVSAALVVLIVLIAFVPAYATDGSQQVGAQGSESVSYRYDKVKSAEDAASFLSQFGWEVKASSLQSGEVTIPAEFDAVYSAYNELQKRQGLDLSRFKKKTVMRYQFEVSNYDGYEGTVYATVLVYRNKVVGGDICSADTAGFLHGFEKP